MSNVNKSEQAPRKGRTSGKKANAGRPQLAEQQERDERIYVAFCEGYTQRTIAAMFSLSVGTVNEAIKRMTKESLSRRTESLEETRAQELDRLTQNEQGLQALIRANSPHKTTVVKNGKQVEVDNPGDPYLCVKARHELVLIAARRAKILGLEIQTIAFKNFTPESISAMPDAELTGLFTQIVSKALNGHAKTNGQNGKAHVNGNGKN